MSRRVLTRAAILLALLLLLFAAVLGALYAEQLHAVPLAQWLEQHSTEAWRVDLNTASAEELLQLYGMTETQATRIVAYRTNFAPYRTPSDLLQVSGVTEAMFAIWEPYLIV